MTVPFESGIDLKVAIFTESILDIWPAPIPTVLFLSANKIALLLTCLTTFHPNSNPSNSSFVGFLFDTTLQSEIDMQTSSASCNNHPPSRERSEGLL